MSNGGGVKTTTPMPEAESLGLPAELLSQGKALQKAGTPFVTAMGVQRKRDLGRVIAAMENEAKFAGDSFYYSLPFGEHVEGPSIGLAVSLAREWGNCAVTMDVQETDDAFLFTARFIDLETGYQLDRAYRQRKAGAVHGKFDPERKLDIAFQIGQSKAIRNVILNATPRWLQDKLVAAAKAAVAAEITPDMLLQERQKIAELFAASFRVTLEMLTAKIGRGLPEWSAMDVATLRGNFKALQSKELTVEELFGVGERKTPAAPAGPVKFEAVADAVAEPGVDEKDIETKALGAGGDGLTPQEQENVKPREGKPMKPPGEKRLFGGR